MSGLRKRHEVPVEETWDLTHIYETEAAFDADLQRLEEETAAFVADCAGGLPETPALPALLDRYEAILARRMRLGDYASLALTTDFSDPVNQARNGRTELVLNACDRQCSFFESALTALTDAQYAALIAADSRRAHTWRTLQARKAHTLAPETEALLTALSPLTGLPESAYEIAKMADLRFAPFEAGGQTRPLDFVSFENTYQYEPDTAVRRAAFDAFSRDLSGFGNTFATLYHARVQSEKALATARGHASVFDYLLFDQQVDRAAYDRQIDGIYTGLAPIMQRYARLLRRVHGWDRITHADLKVPLDPGYAPAVDLAEAKRLVLDALRPMGEEYLGVIRQVLDRRYIDFAQNEGKSTGGFCAMVPGVGSFILMSWNGLLSEVFTLVHELGHAAHFHYCMQHQPLLQTELSLYLIEAPSTCNEMLLSRSLLQGCTDPRRKRWVLSSMLGNTYYHNFVTHLLEAHYQRKVYEAVDRGEALHCERLNALMEETLRGFWGDTVEWTPGAEFTWMRQPHYYAGLYPYTYSAGLTLSTEMSRRITEEGEPAVERWKAFLRAGGSDRPLHLCRDLLGIDLHAPEPLQQTLAYIDDVVRQLEELTDEMETEQ